MGSSKLSNEKSGDDSKMLTRNENRLQSGVFAAFKATFCASFSETHKPDRSASAATRRGLVGC